ncbi:unnamed protein product, partial [Ceratitis capitata]
ILQESSIVLKKEVRFSRIRDPLFRTHYPVLSSRTVECRRKPNRGARNAVEIARADEVPSCAERAAMSYPGRNECEWMG